MWLSAIEAQLGSGGGGVISEGVVRDVIAKYKLAYPTMALSPNKQNLIVGVLCKVPPRAIKIFRDHLQDRMWDRSALNQHILGLRELHVDYSPGGCAGAWSSLLKNTDDVCEDVARNIEHHFLQRVTLHGSRPEATAKKSELSQCRIKDHELVGIQLSCALYHNWLKKEIADKEPWAMEKVEEQWAAGAFHSDLIRIAASKVSAAMAQQMTYQGVASLMALLRQQRAVTGPMSGDLKRRMTEGKRAEFAALKAKVEQVQQEFIDYIDERSGELMNEALARMDVMTQNSDKFQTVCEEFCNTHVRIVCLGSAVALPSVITSMKVDCARLWPSVHNIPTLYLINLADVPLPRSASDKDVRLARGKAQAVVAPDSEDPAEVVASGDLKAERGRKSDWMQLLSSAAQQALAVPSHSVGSPGPTRRVRARACMRACLA